MSLSDSTLIEHFYKSHRDSVVVSKQGIFLSTFKVKDHFFSSETYQESDSSGAVRAIDSFYVSGKGASKIYFNFYQSKNLRLSKTFYPGGKVQNILYFSAGGADSLYREWYDSGVLKSVKRFENDADHNFNHYPHADRKPVENSEYYSNGIVAKKERRDKNYRAIYRESGIRKSVSYDTLINNQVITCEKKYYPNKNIQSVHYFQENKPCFVWLDYSKEGALISSTQKAAVRKIVYSPSEPAAPEVYTQVEEHSEFPAGETALQAYIEKDLKYTTYTYPELLQGNYSVLFEITKEGQAVFISVKGFQTDAIKRNLKQLIELMPRWKPRRMNGRAVNESYELILSAR